MSDYLSTLAARSLQAAPIATPRVASLFEPVAPSAMPIGVPASLDIDAPADAMPREAAPARPAIDLPGTLDTRSPAPHVAPMSSAPRPVHAWHERPERPRIQTIRASDEPAAPSVDPIAIPLRERALPGPQPSPRHDPASPDLVVVHEVLRERSAEHRADPSIPLRLDEVLRRLTDERRPAREPRSLPDDRRAAAAPPPEAAAVPSRDVEARVRPERLARVTREVPLTTTQPPAIRITIGRIDVRAVTPAAAPATPRRSASASSGAITLDDYLKQRSGTAR